MAAQSDRRAHSDTLVLGALDAHVTSVVILKQNDYNESASGRENWSAYLFMHGIYQAGA